MPISPSRLTLARKLRGMTLADLSSLTDLSPQTINRCELGHQEPTADSVNRLADALKLPAAFFHRPDVEPLPTATASLRSPSKTSAFRRDAVLAAALIASEIAAWIGARFRLPRANLPAAPANPSAEDIEAMARRIRNEWGLGQRPIPNLVHLLESRGVRIFSLVQEVRDVDAFSVFLRGEPFIFIDTGKTAERQRFDAAHELGHLVLHQGRGRTDGREAERQADRFAAALLMPRGDVLARNLHRADAARLRQASRRWGVSPMALANRLSELDIITRWRYRTLCPELAESGSHLTAETSQVLEKVFAHLRRTERGVRAIADDLELTPEEFNRHVFGLAAVHLHAVAPAGVAQSSRCAG
ncbi:helix-turn-helix domain-containing protein [Amycolatopsis lurida]